jgi:hypothetical protein
MKQSSLFDDDGATTPGPPVRVPAIASNAHRLTHAQSRFNALLERIRELREERTLWQTFSPAHAQRVATELVPGAARLREQQIALARLFDRNCNHPALGKHGRETLREQLLALLAELLEGEETPELVSLYDRHAGVSRAEEERFGFELLRAVAADLEVDVEAYDGEERPEVFTEWVGRELGGSKSPPRRPSAGRTRERETAVAAESGTRTLRTVFRRLVSTMHPDRETDPHEQRRKTVLMQELNAAYSSGDLLRVLELQQAVDARAAGALAGLADAELAPYLHLLEAQAKRLREEIDALIAPFAAVFPGRSPRSLTPGRIRQSLEQTLAELKHAQRLVAADLERFADVQRLKESLQAIRRSESTERRSRTPRGARRRA